MSTELKIFYPELQRLIYSSASVRVNGNTVGECLCDFVKQYPIVKKLIFDEQGQLLERVYVCVNAESMHKAPFSKEITDTDELILAVLITGG